jgi:hypothetical protein
MSGALLVKDESGRSSSRMKDESGGKIHLIIALAPQWPQPDESLRSMPALAMD